jgi:phasin family protein
MANTVEKAFVASRVEVQALEDLTGQAYARLEKLLRLNMSASRAILEESIGHVRALMAAKDANELLNLQVGQFQALTVKYAVYGKHLFSLVSRTGAEFAQGFKVELRESQKVFSEVMDNVIDNAPLGAESSVAAFRKDITGLQNSIE